VIEHRLPGREKRTQWIMVWAAVATIFCGGAFLLWIGAAPKQSNLPHWPTLPLALIGGAGLYCMVAAARGSWPHRGLGSESPEPRCPPDLPTAVYARFDAVMTNGPARNKRLSETRRDLLHAAESLGSDEQATKVRTRARELADCTDPTRAGDLRDQLVQESG
jgi:hypothetical protein